MWIHQSTTRHVQPFGEHHPASASVSTARDRSPHRGLGTARRTGSRQQCVVEPAGVPTGAEGCWRKPASLPQLGAHLRPYRVPRPVAEQPPLRVSPPRTLRPCPPLPRLDPFDNREPPSGRLCEVRTADPF